MLVPNAHASELRVEYQYPSHPALRRFQYPNALGMKRLSYSEGSGSIAVMGHPMGHHLRVKGGPINSPSTLPALDMF
jgi:hypothetical protein